MLTELQHFSYDRATNYETKYSDSDMYLTMSKELINGIKYVNSMKEDCMYLGWTPYLPIKNTKQLNDICVNVIRNDNNGENDFTEIPLYFICLENQDDGVNVSRIYHNPSIIVDIDIKLMMLHLKDIGRISNVTIHFEHLKFAHAGRWYLDIS